ncbi:Adenylate and Guanylate cyclase catalytic domain family protein [Babesia bovis T2Bo]|uniref:Guanylate cyclase domain-containing protein n=1 Tax=Babesia bovis TaxID=5865 RepID=A7ARC3_BABBO|nr:Adenylate and Guanylate cyclase catalytic domain family protein [Babesia bovis T2Bo]EDO07092.1 Adenylate and Guanylate cyclase catalytic domain family protein [Babesia bovis T2Bo]|eukprot:XP_001610660.1 hypothetical protein [Babesia bovis T2Bo]
MLTMNLLCCGDRGKNVAEPPEESDYIDLADAMREEEQMHEEWEWLSIRCERRLNEHMYFYKKEISDIYDTLRDNGSTSAPDKYTSYVPKLVRRFIHRRIGKHEMPSRTIEECYAVTVFCDASGFTALAEAIERSGDPEAAATLGKSLNDFFDPLISIINNWGGDIMKFAGDAALVAWFIPKNDGHDNHSGTQDSGRKLASGRGAECFEPSHEDAWKQCALALKCCEELHKTLHDFPTNIEGKTLTLHIGVGFGKVCVIHVGGLLERWEVVVAGKPLEEIAVAEPLASSGQTVISQSVYDVMCSHIEVDTIDNYPDYHLFRRFVEDVDVDPGDIVNESFDFPIESLSEFRHYMPNYIFNKLLSGYSTFNNEMRRLSTLFISVPGLDVASKSGRERAHQFMKICQRATYALEGSVNKFLVDDKGVVLLIFIGFPPVYHTDDPVRAVFVGLKIAHDCAKLGLKPGIGITSGSVWCGTLGNDIRREYTCLGDYVNLSARLMGKAARYEQHRILVDEATVKEAGSILEFIELESVKLKGKEAWVKIFTPTGKVRKLDPQALQNMSPLETWRRWESYNEVRRKLLTNGLLERGGVMLVNGHNGCGIGDMQSSIIRLVKQEGFTNCFSVSTMKEDSPVISIASDLHYAWRNLCTSLVSTWATCPARKRMMGAYHSKYRYLQSETGVSKKAVSDIVKELLDPEYHWRVAGIKSLILGLEVEPLRTLFGHSLIPAPQSTPGVMGKLQRWMSEGELRDAEEEFFEADTGSTTESEDGYDSDSLFPEEDQRYDTTLLDQRMLEESIAPFVASMVEGFSLKECICIVLNIRMGSSVYATMADDSWVTVCHLARLAMQRRKELMDGTSTAKPFLFIIMSSPQHIFIRWHMELVAVANECNALIKLPKLTQDQLADFIAHALDLEDSNSVPEELVDYIYQNTSGMPRFAYRTLDKLVASGAIVLEDVETGSAETSDDDEADTFYKTGLLRRDEILDFFHIPRRPGSRSICAEQMQDLGIYLDDPKRVRKRLVSWNLDNYGLIDETLSFAMSAVDRLQPDELFVAKVASVLPSPFTRTDLFGKNPQGFTDEQFDTILRNLLANEIVEPISNIPLIDAASPGDLSLRLASAAIAKVLTQRVMEDERAWFAEHFAVAQ